MRNSDKLVCSGLTEDDAMHVVALLASMDIDPGVVTEEGGTLAVFVAADHYERARRLYEEELGGDQVRAAEAAIEMSSDPFGDPEVTAPATWFGRGTAAVFVLMALCVAGFIAAAAGPDGASRSRLLELGAISYEHIEAGEHWRLLTAVFLHFNVVHLISNLATMLVVAPPLAHQIGGARFAMVFVATGVVGNLVSHQLAPVVGLKAGASGAIAGVLGALAGLALRPGRRTRFRSWQVLAALAGFYGLLIGFGPGRDNVAHLGGLLVGVALGRFLIEPLPESSRPGVSPERLRRTR